MRFKTLASATLLTLAASAAAAYAAPITVAATGSVQTSDPSANFSITTTYYNYAGGATPTGTSSSSGSITDALNVGQTYNLNPVFTYTDINSEHGSPTDTANVEYTITFTEPGSGSGTLSGGDTENVYQTFLGTYNDGSLTWNNANILGVATDSITLSDGAVISVSLDNSYFGLNGGESGGTAVDGSITLVSAPTSVTPEPASLALLATGLLGLPLMFRKHFVA